MSQVVAFLGDAIGTRERPIFNFKGKKVKALYIHGAFSAFKPESEKVKNLQKAFDVVGASYSMESTFDENKDMLVEFCRTNDVDFIVGTSLGGLYASEVSAELSIPAVMINPCVEPAMSLGTIIGTHKNFTTGIEETLTQEIVNTFPTAANVSSNCIIFVGMKDTLIDSQKTIDLYGTITKVVANESEDHYWEFFNENDAIKNHLERVGKNDI